MWFHGDLTWLLSDLVEPHEANIYKNGAKIMPAITIQSLELTDEQKEIIAEKFGRIFSELTKVPIDRIYIFFDGYPLDCAATNGMLFSKNPPKVAVGKFSQERKDG